MESRKANIERRTGETQISVAIDLDGVGDYNIKTGNGMFDHLLAQLSRHGLIDLEIEAQGMSRSGGTTWSKTRRSASDAPQRGRWRCARHHPHGALLRAAR